MSIKPLREIYPTMKFDGKVYQFYASRIYKSEAKQDKGRIKARGENARIVKKHGRYLVFQRR